MKRAFVLGLAAVWAMGTVGRAQESKDGMDKEIDAQIQKAMEGVNAAPKTKVEMPEMKDNSEEEDAKEEAGKKAAEVAAAKAAVNAKGPAVLPPWTPEVPKFTATGPVTRMLEEGEPRIVLAGTSPLSPEALADAWDAFKKPGFSHERTGSDINGLVDLHVTFRNGEDGSQVTMEAARKAGGKVTRVTVWSPIPIPVVGGGE